MRKLFKPITFVSVLVSLFYIKPVHAERYVVRYVYLQKVPEDKVFKGRIDCKTGMICEATIGGKLKFRLWFKTRYHSILILHAENSSPCCVFSNRARQIPIPFDTNYLETKVSTAAKRRGFVIPGIFLGQFAVNLDNKAQ